MIAKVVNKHAKTLRGYFIGFLYWCLCVMQIKIRGLFFIKIVLDNLIKISGDYFRLFYNGSGA
jgi:hypothetical protein